MKASFVSADLPDKGVVVVFVLEDLELTASARKLDNRFHGVLTRSIKASRFRGKKDQSLTILAPADSGIERVVLVGLGKATDIDAPRAQAAGGQICAALAPHGIDQAFVAVDAISSAPLSSPDLAVEIAFGAKLRAYRFDKYLTKEKEEEKPKFADLHLGCADPDRAIRLFSRLEKIVDAIYFTRDLVSEPSNVIFPESLSSEAKRLEKLGVEVEILGEKEMRKLGMNALLGVGQGSERESQLVVLQWWGAGKPEEKPKKNKDKDKKEGEADNDTANAAGPIALLGKGVTFDTGGISIKPAQGMEEMKWDMAGAAAVIGAMYALAAREAKVNVIGIVGLVENMPSGRAQRPGDVVKSMSGQTIEVINTDAEGRLVLCDALWYCKQRFHPRLMIDLATLTGAIVIALGHEHAGLFCNDDDVALRLVEAGKAVGEPLWRMPLGEAYDKMIKSDVADMKNVGDRGAGSITAAQFLQRFVGKTPWAHIDIAGVAWSTKDRDTTPKGASGFGVRLLDRFVADSDESEEKGGPSGNR